MRKLIVFVAFAGLVLGMGIQGAQAGHEGGGPGPNGHNNHGLCTAYFNGSENGRNHKHQAGPFVALEGAANARDGVDNDEDGQKDEADEVAQAVWDWCMANTGDKGIGGQPENPYPTTTTATQSAESTGSKGRGKG